jgi:hypothetical protein
MTDMAGVTQPSELARGNQGLEKIERAGTEITPAFVEAFNKMSPEERNIWVEDANRNILSNEFGWAVIFLDDPELGPLLRRAVGPPAWAPDKLAREVRKTNWWKSRTDAQRSWDQSSQFDPASAQRQVDAQSIGIRSVASQYGAMLSDEQVATLATESLRSGWTSEQIIQAVASEIVKGSDPTSNIRFGITGQSVRQVARQFGVPLSEQAADDWAQKIATGQAFQDDFNNWARMQARSLYPSLAADIDRGLNVETIVDPYIQVAVRTLGIAPTQVDFSDPRWNAALNFDEGKGRRMMTLYEWGRHLRQDASYGYDQTPEARDKAYRMATDLSRMFGLMA